MGITQPQETWAKIDNYPDYEISDFGRIRSTKLSRGGNWIIKELTPCDDGRGYLYVHIRQNMKDFFPKIHWLVAETFLGTKPIFESSRTEINHIDGDKSNNKKSNLEYVSAKQNKRHAIKIGLHKKVAHNLIRLTKEDILEIKTLEAQGMAQSKIAQLFNVAQSHISHIVNEKCWGWL